MKEVVTDDKSITYYSKKYSETYHSVSGAKEEAIEKFAKPTLQHCQSKEIQVLDVCFGLGYNTAALLDLFKGRTLGVVGVEIDERIMQHIKNIPEHTFDSYHLIKKVAQQQTPDHLRHLHTTYHDVHIDMLLMQDDILKVLPRLPDDSFDIVLFDPFSPSKCPELWSFLVFKELFRVCKKNAILTTYSCAQKARGNMRLAGFLVKDGPCIGRRSPATLAIKP